MSIIKIDNPLRSPDFITGIFSDAILAGDFLFVSGQASVDFKTSQFVLGTIEEETYRTLTNIKSIVEAAGGKMVDVVKCTVHLKDIEDFDRYNVVYAQFFPVQNQREQLYNLSWERALKLKLIASLN